MWFRTDYDALCNSLWTMFVVSEKLSQSIQLSLKHRSICGPRQIITQSALIIKPLFKLWFPTNYRALYNNLSNTAWGEVHWTTSHGVSESCWHLVLEAAPNKLARIIKQPLKETQFEMRYTGLIQVQFQNHVVVWCIAVLRHHDLEAIPDKLACIIQQPLKETLFEMWYTGLI